MAKVRLDQLVFERGLTPSRERAKTSIMAGLIFVNGQKETKPGMSFPSDVEITLKGEAVPYVSRGGLKLEKAIKSFAIDPAGYICGDFGASTGGFTDVLLKNNAQKVYAVDVGYGQLAWQLRQDPRVVCLERTNVRYITHEIIPEELDLITMDLSFISLRLILPAVFNILKENGHAVCLVKPQFEAGKEKVGKKGVVRDPLVHEEVISDFLGYASETGFKILNMDYSPIRGPEGNIEYLAYLGKSDNDIPFEPDIKSLVEASHNALEKDRSVD